jgi:GntR family transcriptional regulator
VRIRAASRPVLLYITFIPEPIGCKFSKRDYARTPHHELIRQAGIRVTSAEQIITAGLAEPIVASRLKIEVGSPLLKLRTMFFDDGSRPVRYLEVLASPSMFELQMAFGPDDWRARLRRPTAVDNFVTFTLPAGKKAPGLLGSRLPANREFSAWSV